MSFYVRDPKDWAKATYEVDDIAINVEESPVSHQARGSSRQQLIDSVRELTRPCDFVFTNDVRVDIEWCVSEATRYESDCAADVDNIIKPLVDAISGPDGLLINDCQVQAVTSYWIGNTSEHQSIAIRVCPLLESWKKRKANLFFVQYRNALCFPLDDSWPPDLIARIGHQIREMLDTRDEYISCGKKEAARSALPCQRLYHRTRTSGFPVIIYEEFEKKFGPVRELSPIPTFES